MQPTFRSITPDDLPRLTQIAQRGMEFDTFDEALVREKTIGAFDFDPELGLVAEIGRGGVATGADTGADLPAIAGFAQGAMGQMEKNRTAGYVRLMVIDRAARRQGIGSALLGEMERRLRERGAETVHMFDCPHNYFTPGVDFRYTEAYCFLQKHGYEMHRENHNLLCDLDVNAWPTLEADAAAMSAHGIEVRRATLADQHAIDEFLASEWPAWRFEVHAALWNTPPTLYIGLMEGRVVAFSGYQGNNKSLSWFGPMGTSPVLRGKGIGAILLRLCLRDLARQGFPTSIIPWVGPIRFYARFSDARIDRCFWAWRKALNQA